MKIVTGTFIAILAIVAVTFFLKWTNQHDDEVRASAEQYEKCIVEEYHTTPNQYFYENGEYPICPAVMFKEAN